MAREREAARNDRAVALAARTVFADQGLDAPMSAIAQRAGVGIASLYRRYPTKAHLVAEMSRLAWGELRDAVELALGNRDVARGFRRFIERSVENRTAALADLANPVDEDDHLTIKLIGEMTNRAVVVGVARSDLDPDDVIDIITIFGQVSNLTRQRLRSLSMAVDGLLLPNFQGRF